ncbi:MAG: VWA domain-containing protein [Acetatifactor sp.]|nr:VWA domain-containing protein [Acetatifactor sp.]
MDTDGDGIPDNLEIAWGLDYANPDTDGDGLTDYAELYLTCTDPMLTDTDGDGISDEQEDLDQDGLTNLEEINYGTNPASADSDRDDLTDYEEIFLYQTNPNNPDTDGDGLTDYDDVYLGFSPLLADTDGNGIIDAEETLLQTVEESFPEDEGKGLASVTVSLQTPGNAQNNVYIRNTYQEDALSRDVVGLVGVPIEIHADTPFDTAELTFHYEESALQDVEEENLQILWYDEEQHWYQLLDSTVNTEQNTVTYTTTHFSTYMLVNSAAWYEAWRENIDYRNSSTGDARHAFDIVFVVDTSYSMKGEPLSSTKKALTNFVDAMQNGDDAAIVNFANWSYTACSFTDNVLTLKQSISRLQVASGTRVSQGLNRALDLLKDRQNEKQKIIILICDGDVDSVQNAVNICVEQNIQIYTVYIGSSYSYSETALKNMATLTGGQHYSNADSKYLETMMGFVQDNTVSQIDPTDTDGDGLYDIYETAGIRLPNGQVVYTDPNKTDTDGDGLSDFEETGLIYQLDERYRNPLIPLNTKYFVLRSNPTKADTDEDGIPDNKDEHPWSQDAAWVAQLDNRYPRMEYLKVKGPDDALYPGGNQGWWADKATGADKLNYKDFATDSYYRLWQMGCGVIAMSDAELYLTQQNPGYHSAYSEQDTIAYNSYNGIIVFDDYKEYVEENYSHAYPIPGDLIHYQTGLPALSMESGMENFLKNNDSTFHSAQWAPYSMQRASKQRQSVLKEIETMLNNNLPVVFNYYSFDEDNKIDMYPSIHLAQNKNTKNDKHRRVVSHYMTIIGLYKYLDNTTHQYQYIMQIVSWGNIYYIRYDQYADNLSCFSNILKIS